MANGKGTASCGDCKHSSFKREPPDSWEAPMFCGLWDVTIPVRRYGGDNLFCSHYESKEHPGHPPMNSFNPAMKENVLYAVFYNDIHQPNLWREVYDLRLRRFSDGRANEIAPVVLDGITYSAPHFRFARTPSEWKACDHAGGFVEARDSKSNQLLWWVEIYKPNYDPRKPRHLQDNFVVSLSVDGSELNVKTESGEVYSVNPKDRSVKKVGS